MWISCWWGDLMGSVDGNVERAGSKCCHRLCGWAARNRAEGPCWFVQSKLWIGRRSRTKTRSPFSLARSKRSRGPCISKRLSTPGYCNHFNRHLRQQSVELHEDEKDTELDEVQKMEYKISELNVLRQMKLVMKKNESSKVFIDNSVVNEFVSILTMILHQTAEAL